MIFAHNEVDKRNEVNILRCQKTYIFEVKVDILRN